MKFQLNGQLMQDASTSLMIHDVFEQVSYASHIITLRVGDVIARQPRRRWISEKTANLLQRGRHGGVYLRGNRDADESSDRSVRQQTLSRVRP